MAAGMGEPEGRTLISRRVRCDSLVEDPRNARLHDGRNLAGIKSSLENFGQREPLVVRDGVVIGGNGRLRAMRELKWEECWVTDHSDLTEAQARALGVVLNRTAEVGTTWHPENLRLAIEQVTLECPEVSLDFKPVELAAIMPKPDVTEDEAPAPAAEAFAQRGDIICLGKHRVMCGDSTSAEDVAALMMGERVGLVFTSPPYAQQRDYGQKIEDWDGLMRGVFGNLPAVTTDDVQILVNLGLIHRDGEWVPYWDGWIEWMRAQGWRRFGWYVWDKKAALPGEWSGRLAPVHEWVFHFNKATAATIKAEASKYAGNIIHGSAPRAADGVRRPMHGTGNPRNEFRVRDSICSAAKETSGGLHPARMPVGLPAYFCGSWDGDVYDPFLGSGTTLIAADQLDRRCFGMELEPRYVDVIVRRFIAHRHKQGKAPAVTGWRGDVAAEVARHAARGAS